MKLKLAITAPATNVVQSVTKEIEKQAGSDALQQSFGAAVAAHVRDIVNRVPSHDRHLEMQVEIELDMVVRYANSKEQKRAEVREKEEKDEQERAERQRRDAEREAALTLAAKQKADEDARVKRDTEALQRAAAEQAENDRVQKERETNQEAQRRAAAGEGNLDSPEPPTPPKPPKAKDKK